MFWRRKTNHLKETTRKDIIHKLLFLESLLGKDWLYSFETLKPQDFQLNETDQKKAASVIFNNIKCILGFESEDIKLDFFWEKPLQSKDPFAILNTAEYFKFEKLTLGLYQKKESTHTISIEMAVLRNQNLLVYTLAHEMAHFILQGEKHLFFNDEKITDLLVLTLGFGPFWCALQDSILENPKTKTGYLTEDEGIFALAWLKYHKTESLKLSIKNKRLSEKYQDALKQIKKKKKE